MTRVGLCRASHGKGNTSFLCTAHPGFHDRFSQRHHIEAEHLLLGIARAIEPELKELLRLKEVEDGVPCGVNPWVHSEEEQSR